MARRRSVWLVLWALSLIAASVIAWRTTAAHSARAAVERTRAFESHIAEVEGLLIAETASKSELDGRLEEWMVTSSTLRAELDRTKTALLAADRRPPKIVEVVRTVTEASEPVREVVERWLAPVCPGQESSLPLPTLYATTTEARLETDAGSVFAVGEVEVYIQTETLPHPLLWSGLWRAEASELFRVAEPARSTWRVDLMAGLTTGPGWAVGAQWHAQSRWGLWGVYSRDFQRESFDGYSPSSDLIVGGASFTLGRR